jgi:hypothetical protein
MLTSRSARRRLDRNSGRIIVARREISANRLDVRREHLHIGNAQPSSLLHHIVLRLK